MFTYVVEDKVLFPCDFFGAHTAFGMYDDENDGLIPLAQRYYGEIMMPFGRMGARALEKIAPLDIRLIAPSHGPIYRNPGRIVDEYRKWTAGETREKAIIAFVSMWGSTDRMAKAMAKRWRTGASRSPSSTCRARTSETWPGNSSMRGRWSSGHRRCWAACTRWPPTPPAS